MKRGNIRKCQHMPMCIYARTHTQSFGFSVHLMIPVIILNCMTSNLFKSIALKHTVSSLESISCNC